MPYRSARLIRADVLLLLLGMSIRCGAETAGDPQRPDGLAREIADLCQHGATRITITPGIYALSDTLVLEHLHHVVLDFSKVEISLTSSHDGIAIMGCQDVVLRGATMHYDHPRFCQAKILAFGSDGQYGGYYDVQIDAGYPRNADFTAAYIFDPQQRRIKFHSGDAKATHRTALTQTGQERIFWGTLAFQPPHYPVEIGDYLVCRGDGGSLLHADSCTACTFQDLTFYWGGIFGIFETGPSSGNRYRHITLTTGPLPPGATNRPLISQSADGLHSAGARVGPDIENCDFESMCDDGFAIHGYFQDIIAVRDTALTIKESSFRIGDSARVSSRIGYSEQATVTAIEQLPDGTHRLTLDKPLQAHPGDKVGNPNASGMGYRIIGNTIRNNRARGILAKGDNGLIADNTIDGCTMSGISIGPEYYWNESDYCHGVVIRHNRISNTNYATNDFGRNGAILIHGDGAKGNRDITIIDNTICGVPGPNLIIQWAEGVTVQGNSFIEPNDRAVGTDAIAGTLVWLESCSSITFSGNQLVRPGSALTSLVVRGADVRQIHGQEDGIVRK